MYPNLYYVFKDWFGVSWTGLGLFNSFGLLVALSFLGAAYTLTQELKRKEKAGHLHPVKEVILVGKGASMAELLINGLLGFLFGYKIMGAFFDKQPDVSFQDYLFSRDGNWIGGLLLGLGMLYLKYNERKKNRLQTPEKREVQIWPHDRVGDLVLLAMVFGVIGAKLFDSMEHFSDFIQDPIGTFFSNSGLTFYGGLILAAAAILWYARKKQIAWSHLTDAVAPGLMLAYAVGRLGCQIAGDGDWGIYNSAYTVDAQGKTVAAAPAEFRNRLVKDSNYYLHGIVTDTEGNAQKVTDRSYTSLQQVPQASIKGSILPAWFFAYAYPQNVNKDGIVIAGVEEEHNRMLPQPVFPTPLYEAIICLIFFFIMWGVRKKIQVPWRMFGLYLILNGMERYIVEKIRVNQLYEIMGMSFSQAGIIAIVLMISGLLLLIMTRKRASQLEVIRNH